jgi:hypothetical protein
MTSIEVQNAAEIARVSAQLSAAVDSLQKTAERLEKAQAETRAQVDLLKQDIVHYKGIVGGVMFLVSAMWAFLVAFKTAIFRGSA